MASCFAFSAALAASSAACFATKAIRLSVGGALALPTSHALPPDTRTCTVSPACASMVSLTGVSSTPPGICTHAVPPSMRLTSAVVSYPVVVCFMATLIASVNFFVTLLISSSPSRLFCIHMSAQGSGTLPGTPRRCLFLGG